MAECPILQTEMLLATDRICRERLRGAADHARLVRLARSAEMPYGSAVDDMLAEVGEALIWVGEKLLARHSSDGGLLVHHRTGWPATRPTDL